MGYLAIMTTLPKLQISSETRRINQKASGLPSGYPLALFRGVDGFLRWCCGSCETGGDELIDELEEKKGETQALLFARRPPFVITFTYPVC